MRDHISDKVSRGGRGEGIGNFRFHFSQTETEKLSKQRVKTAEDLVVWKSKGPNGNLVKGEKCPLTGFWFWENIAKCGCRGKDDDDEHDDYDDDDDDDYYDDDDYDDYDDYDDDYAVSNYEYDGDGNDNSF